MLRHTPQKKSANATGCFLCMVLYGTIHLHAPTAIAVAVAWATELYHKKTQKHLYKATQAAKLRNNKSTRRGHPDLWSIITEFIMSSYLVDQASTHAMMAASTTPARPTMRAGAAPAGGAAAGKVGVIGFSGVAGMAGVVAGSTGAEHGALPPSKGGVGTSG
jgi:hypothetical protein